MTLRRSHSTVSEVSIRSPSFRGASKALPAEQPHVDTSPALAYLRQAIAKEQDGLDDEPEDSQRNIENTATSNSQAARPGARFDWKYLQNSTDVPARHRSAVVHYVGADRSYSSSRPTSSNAKLNHTGDSQTDQLQVSNLQLSPKDARNDVKSWTTTHPGRVWAADETGKRSRYGDV